MRNSAGLMDTVQLSGIGEVRNTEPPTTLSLPNTVSPPSTVALAYTVTLSLTVG